MIQIRKPSVRKHSDLHLIERTVMSFSVNSSQDSRTCFVAVKALFPLCFKACCPSTVWFQERSAPSVPGKTGTPCHQQRLCRTKQHPMHYKKKRKKPATYSHPCINLCSFNLHPCLKLSVSETTEC